ncbi:hypothetical protein LCGC14_1828030 [marine sediment metagenome]|uniref:Uncharacterized protein n=1 Tax=marine sediment metagenome TaxID=412755 RepID=A0A0F9H531_9ZZZZ
MEAKDTVVGNNTILTILGKRFYERFTVEEVAKIQAEISFKAGIREVVEWVDKHSVGITSDNELKNITCWQAKLKEWGIK